MPRPRRADRNRLDLRLDPETARDLAALEENLRQSPSGVVRLAIAELARARGLRQNGHRPLPDAAAAGGTDAP
jgi:predicted transcriptional regulator